ncbi:MAG: hypothetical protein EP301_08120 [Gammaproteobacteria bacterium]|nr:MAG: hypothetical protein EP301_08120 [Gammaproteobacteria bacterium]
MLRISRQGMVLSLILAAMAGGTKAAASDGQLRKALAECRAVTTAIGRLDCYDAIALEESAAISSPGNAEAEATRVESAPTGADSSAAGAVAGVATTAALEPAGDRPSEEEAFGFEFDVKDALQSVTSDITEVRKNAKGALVLTLANGQVWQQSDGQTLFLDEGDSVTISRGALSAFYLTKDGKGRRYKFARAR